MRTFASGGIAIAVDAADGGRITSLIAHGHEWLAPSAPRGAHESFVAAGTGGWDEVAPTVRAVTLPDGTVLRDHGDAWRVPWAVLRESPGLLTMAVELDSVGVRLERDIRASENGIRLEYRATTTSTEPVPLLWCAHPLFDASGGACIVATGELTEEYPVVGAPVAWPSALPRTALKAFASGVTSAQIVHPDDRAVRLSWSLPHVGFYWDGGEFSDIPVIAIEPSTGASDSAALVLDSLPTVTDGRPLEWWVELSL